MRRCLRRLGFTYRRARRVPPKAPPEREKAPPEREKAPPEREKARARRALTRLHRLEGAGKCQVLYADESGFCLQPCVPYLWQRRGQAVGLPARGQAVGLPAQAHSRRLNVLGLLRRDGRLWSYPTQGTLTALHLIESVEAFLPQMERPTVLVLDNAAVHRAKAVQQKRREWKAKGLRLLFLPPYCPHLNLIETLWRLVKHRWLAPETYADFATLCRSVLDILAQVGTRYRITFA